MKPRYFETYFSDDPMTELDENAALDSGYYVKELDSPRRYESFIAGSLARVNYPEAPTDELQRFHRERYPDLDAWFYGPTTHEGTTRRKTIWEFDRSGALTHRNDYVYEPRRTTHSWYDAAGKYGGKLERIYDEHGEEIEVREHSPDGRVLVHA